jgi:hypothetical protein
MELLIEARLVPTVQISGLLRETDETIAMTLASIQTLQKRKVVLCSIENLKSKI